MKFRDTSRDLGITDRMLTKIFDTFLQFSSEVDSNAEENILLLDVKPKKQACVECPWPIYYRCNVYWNLYSRDVVSFMPVEI